MTSKPDLAAFQLTDARNEWLLLAQSAVAAGRGDDAFEFMRALAGTVGDGDLTVPERNCLAATAKQVIAARRAAWRSLAAGPAVVETYRKQIAGEFESIGLEFVSFLEGVLLPRSHGGGAESRVQYLGMSGDLYAALAEGVGGKGYDGRAAASYEEAIHLADGSLLPTHPVRLGLVLNYAVCMYEILKDQKKACELAKKAFDDALSKLDQLDEASYKDVTLIMQLLRDNLTAWTGGSSSAPDER